MADDHSQRIQAAVTAGVPMLYANGFAMGIPPAGDVVVVLEANGRPIAIVNVTLSIAKTMAIAMGGVVSQTEEKLGSAVLTTHELEKLLVEKTDH